MYLHVSFEKEFNELLLNLREIYPKELFELSLIAKSYSIIKEMNGPMVFSTPIPKFIFPSPSISSRE